IPPRGVALVCCKESRWHVPRHRVIRRAQAAGLLAGFHTPLPGRIEYRAIVLNLPLPAPPAVSRNTLWYCARQFVQRLPLLWVQLREIDGQPTNQIPPAGAPVWSGTSRYPACAPAVAEQVAPLVRQVERLRT